jgi:beta-glucosidase
LDGDGQERSDDDSEEEENNKILMRKVASESIVLLRNEGDDVLPLNPQKLRKIAIIGPNAKAIILSGGGSTILKPNFYVNPYDGIVSALEQAGSGTEVTYSEGVRGLFSFFSSFSFFISVPIFSNLFL